MTTAVDTSILLDILIPGAEHSATSREALDRALDIGTVVVSEPVFAELVPRFRSVPAMDAFLDDIGARFLPSLRTTLFTAGAAWRAYVARRPKGLQCQKCGSVTVARCARCDEVLSARQHLVADFMIGAHALMQADGLLTRDRGYYKTYFPDLKIL